MRQLSTDGQATISELARRFGFSSEAVTSMLEALVTGMPGMAQFDHSEFGGRGQWMRGGMTMISAMFDAALKARVEQLCEALSQAAARPGFYENEASETGPIPRVGAGGDRDWWPGNFGSPDSAGAQNGMRYAYFGAPRRLAIEVDGRVTLYDTLDYQISGVAQQQSVGGTVRFGSERGSVDLRQLPIVADGSPDVPGGERVDAQGGERVDASSGERVDAPSAEIIATIERLHELSRHGVLSDDEFSAKKTELLRRI